MRSTIITASIFSLLSYGLKNQHHHVHAFPISSSKSSSKKILSNQKSKGAKQGFGKQSKQDSPVPIQHTIDDSQTTMDLIKFLTSQNAIGLSSSESSAEQKGCDIGICNTTGRRGLYTTKPFRKNDIICRIPSDCVLALSNPDLGGTDTPTLAHCGRNFLDMYQNNPVASKTWKAYLNTLPTISNNFDATPDFFNDEEIESMEFPLIIDEVKRHLVEIAEVCASSCEDTDNGIPFEDLQFATWLVSSRSVEISIDDNSASKKKEDLPDGVLAPPSKSIRVMIPYLDMINHSEDANSELHLIDPEKDNAWFTMRATRNIRPGKEITMSYGSGVETSVELLKRYGFVPEENKFDKFMLQKGGDGCMESLESWSTTLEEDEKALADGSGLTENMKKALQLRCKLKRSYA